MNLAWSLEEFDTLLKGGDTTDYERYVNTPQLLIAQKPLVDVVNGEEVMFQIVHQVVELWMKLISVSLYQTIQRMQEGATNRVLALFGRINQLQRYIIDHLGMINSMSPMDYEEIRAVLGDGSVRESPTYRMMVRMHKPVFEAFQEYYLGEQSVDDLYRPGGEHTAPYMIAEALIQYDETFQLFRYAHIQLLHRTIGPGALSLKGHQIDKLNDGLQSKLWPSLWKVRTTMNEAWNKKQGLGV